MCLRMHTELGPRACTHTHTPKWTELGPRGGTSLWGRGLSATSCCFPTPHSLDPMGVWMWLGAKPTPHQNTGHCHLFRLGQELAPYRGGLEVHLSPLSSRAGFLSAERPWISPPWKQVPYPRLESRVVPGAGSCVLWIIKEYSFFFPACFSFV